VPRFFPPFLSSFTFKKDDRHLVIKRLQSNQRKEVMHLWMMMCANKDRTPNEIPALKSQFSHYPVSYSTKFLNAVSRFNFYEFK
jgi:hypothetical protein